MNNILFIMKLNFICNLIMNIKINLCNGLRVDVELFFVVTKFLGSNFYLYQVLYRTCTNKYP